MATLKSRLSRLQTEAGAPAQTRAEAPDRGDGGLRQRLAHLRPERIQAAPAATGPRLSGEALAAALNGEMPAPGLIRLEARIPLSESLGATPLHGVGDIPPLPGEAASLPSVYLDTETTGLAGGSGTLAFLIGIAVVEPDAIRLTQFLITRFGSEPRLLAELSDVLPADARLVSYNGKTYDLPLLATRFRLQGLDNPFTGRPHLDLLHPTRRLFARRWPDCRLTRLERNLLGFTRQDDLPGSEAPQAWFDYMRTGRADLLIRVVAHNRQDILSLAAGHRALAEAVRRPAEYGVDLHALGRWLAERDESRALALLSSNRDALCHDGKRLLAGLLRRSGCWEEAVGLWEQLAACGCTDSLERLAKYHEHINRDLTAALHYCERLPASEPTLRRRRRLQDKLKIHICRAQ